MAIHRCERCQLDIIGPADIGACPWCQSPVTIIVHGTSPTETEYELQRAQIIIDRLAAALFGPGLRDFDRVARAREVVEHLAPQYVAKFNAPSNGGKP